MNIRNLHKSFYNMSRKLLTTDSQCQVRQDVLLLLAVECTVIRSYFRTTQNCIYIWMPMRWQLSSAGSGESPKTVTIPVHEKSNMAIAERKVTNSQGNKLQYVQHYEMLKNGTTMMVCSAWSHIGVQSIAKYIHFTLPLTWRTAWGRYSKEHAWFNSCNSVLGPGPFDVSLT